MKGRAFTLIELLVVIAVLGLLASIVLVSLKGTRDKAKDVKTVREVEEIIKALILYNYDNPNEGYPLPLSPRTRCLGRGTGETCDYISSSGIRQVGVIGAIGDSSLNDKIIRYISPVPYPEACDKFNSYIYSRPFFSPNTKIVWPFKTDAVRCPGVASETLDDCGRRWCWQDLPQ